MHIESLKISSWLVQKPRKHRSWLAGRGWQVVVAELIPAHDPKQAISLAQIKNLTMTMIEYVTMTTQLWRDHVESDI